MPRISARKELWVINPGATKKTNKTPKKITCSPSPVSAKEGSRRWDQESFKKFKEKPEDPEGIQDQQVETEKMSVERSKPREKEEEEVIYISSDSSMDMVLTDMKKEEDKPKVRRRGRPRKVLGEKSEENLKSKKKKSQVKTKMKNQVENKNLVLSKTGGEAATLQEEGSSKNSEEEESESEEFEKNLKHDINFVLAKYVVDMKVAFDIDKDKNITGFRKKMMGAIRRGDILTLRKSLEGENVHVPKDIPMPSSGRVPAAGDAPTPRILSNESSPDASFEWIIDENASQMPVISSEEMEPRRNPQSVFGKKSTAKTKKDLEQVKSKVKIPLKPLKMFKTIKKTSFKIPRKTEAEKARKEKVPRWVANGALWRWALTVDENGQSSR